MKNKIMVIMFLLSTVFIINSEEAMRIINNGNVGINTLTPTEKLEVNGNVKVTGEIIDTGYNVISNTSYIMQNSDPNKIFANTTADTVITLPVLADNLSREITFVNIGTFNLTVKAAGSELINGTGEWGCPGRLVLKAIDKGASNLEWIVLSVDPLPTMMVEDRKAYNEPGGTSTGGNTWQTRDLNNIIKNEIAGSSLNTSNGHITLPAGEYEIQWSAPVYFGKIHQTRFLNINDNLYYLGTCEYSHNSSNADYDSYTVNSSKGSVILLIESEKIFRIEHKTANSVGNTGLGQSSANISDSIYSQIIIRKRK